MRVILFQGRQKGVVVNLPGDYPLEEIGELLGGDPDEHMIRLDKRLALVEVENKTQLPNQYVLECMGLAPRLIRGECVVVRMGQDKRLGDVNASDVMAAQDYIIPLEVAG